MKKAKTEQSSSSNCFVCCLSSSSKRAKQEPNPQIHEHFPIFFNRVTEAIKYGKVHHRRDQLCRCSRLPLHQCLPVQDMQSKLCVLFHKNANHNNYLLVILRQIYTELDLTRGNKVLSCKSFWKWTKQNRHHLSSPACTGMHVHTHTCNSICKYLCSANNWACL